MRGYTMPRNSNNDVAFDEFADVSHLLAKEQGWQHKLLSKTTVKPKNQSKIILGEFAPDENIRGFVVSFDPQTDPKNAATTVITRLKSADKQRYIMHIENFGLKEVIATIHQL